MNQLNPKTIDLALGQLGEHLAHAGPHRYELVICGGAALISCALVQRLTTRDVDIVALKSNAGLISPDPLPEILLRTADRVRMDLDLPENWINNGPSREPGGLFQVGLPQGLESRLTSKRFGPNLTVYFISRIDQIHFKLFASVDSGPGRHVEDLRDLKPTPQEIEQAAKWAVQHDPSDGFKVVLMAMLKQMGFVDVAERL